ncbi:putative nucleotidyltransferase, ribonuclease H [Tanacetum coccineum]
MPDNMKLQYTVTHLEWDAIQWHRAFMKTPMGYDDDLHEYNNAFDALLNKVTLSETQAVSLYLKGLKPEIRGPVKMFKHGTLHEAYGLAKIQNLNNTTLENKLTSAKGGATHPKNTNETGLVTPPINGSKLPLLPTPNTRPIGATTTKTGAKVSRRITSKELELKRAKGECFWCIKKFVPCHKCPRNQLFIIEVEDEDEAYEENKEDEEDKLPQISIHALTGLPSYSAMRIKGAMGNRQLHILVDSGSTHNFIDVKLKRKLQCTVKDIPSLNVSVAGGKQLQCNQICHDFQWTMQGHWFTTKVLLIQLESYDMILGIQWISPLQDILWNFQKMTMRFEVDGKPCELKGIQSNKVSLCSIEKVDSLLQKHSKDGSIQLYSLQLTTPSPKLMHHSDVIQDQVTEGVTLPWQELVRDFKEVFQPPKSLPPERPFDHRIILKEGTTPISQRPYRYPAVQKDIIEKTTRELLEAGVIRNSQSSFAALVVLVKKKDSQWRMCIDYCRLNDSTVKDKFPIPLIEELLDELGEQLGSLNWICVPGTISRDVEQHKQHLRRILSIINEHQLFAKESKCVFGSRAVEYTGHIISGDGVRSDPSKKDAFKWGDRAQRAFEELKSALTSAPEQHPISYLSKALSPKQQTLSVYEKELLAILMAVKKWHYYLITGPFIIRTDQNSLKHLLAQKVTTPLQHKWLAKLLGYDYTIEYKKGRENVAADALSRVQGVTLFTMAISQVEPLLLEKVIASQEADIQLQAIKEQIKRGVQLQKITWNGKWLSKKNCMIIGGDAQLRAEIIRLCHESPMGGHSGVNATVQRIKGMFYWKGISKGVRQLVRNCDVCMRAKHEYVASPGLLQPLPIPDTIFSEISMDFIGGLPKVNGKDIIFVVVDRLTKYSHFMMLGHPYSAKEVAQVFLDNVYKLHGCPSSIISDRDPIFLSSFWKEFLALCMVMERPHTWVKWVALAEWYTTFHSSIGKSPFEALYGFPPPLQIPYIPKDAIEREVDDFMRDREAVVKLLKQSLQKAQNRMKQQADKHRTKREFEAGSWVYLKLQPYIQNTLRVHKHSKLTPKYFGPFLVVERVGKVAYRLDLPDETQIHPVFHVSLLKLAGGPPDKVIPIPTDARFCLQPSRVLDRKLVKRGSRVAMKILVLAVGELPKIVLSILNCIERVNQTLITIYMT